jgi:parallel beta-helix repeat protein
MFRSWLQDLFARSGNHQPKKRAHRKPARRHRLWLEGLEDRTLPSTWTVTQSTDDGKGDHANTLSWAIDKANKDSGDVIAINVSIVQPSALEPTITSKVAIEGNANELDGSNLALSTGQVEGGALLITGGGCTVEDLTITGFPTSAITLKSNDNVVEDNDLSGNFGDGVYVHPGNDNLVVGNTIENNVANTVKSFGGKGIHIAGSANNSIDANVVSGNASYGIWIEGAGGATNNLVEGNFIGTDPTGTVAMGNGAQGVFINNGATDNTIGGSTAGAGNIISGNTGSGVFISDSGTSGNVVLGNVIGANASGSAAIPNGSDGIHIQNGATGNTVGGTSSADANLVSGNASNGIEIDSSDNVVMGNDISGNGTGAGLGEGVQIYDPNTTGSVQGNFVVGNTIEDNTRNGIFIWYAANNTIGGTAPGDANVLSGNTENGITVSEPSATGNLIEGNFIGTDSSGTVAVPNANGVDFTSGADDNTVSGNTIAGNANSGVLLHASGTSDNVVEANYIGVNSSSAAVPNGTNGVLIEESASDNTIAANWISGNSGQGVWIDGSGTTGNVVSGNHIGTDGAGTTAVPNGADGVLIQNSASGNTIGGMAAGAGNLISGNAYQGIAVIGSGTNENQVLDNDIGTDISGTTTTGADGNPLGNGVGTGSSGIWIDSGPQQTLVQGNLISGNGLAGIAIGDDAGAGTTKNVIASNTIGTNAAGTAALGNGIGVDVYGGTSDTITGNLISGNNGAGVLIQGVGTNQNVVDGNDVGTDYTRNAPLGNVGVGVFIAGGAQANLIGTNGDGVDDAAEANVIAANAYQGVAILGTGTNLNVVAGNYIGTNAAGTAALGNGNNGVWILQGAEDNQIGTNGTDADAAREGNIISGNSFSGVTITDAGTSGNLIAGNRIGTDVTGQTALPNGEYGVNIANGAQNDTIGGSVALSNTIAFNSWAGVVVGSSGADTTTTGNSIRANAIFANGALGIDLGNDGVSGNQLGGPFSGPNDFQNYPVITTASPGTSTIVNGTFNGAANTTFTLDFYSSPAPDPSGYGQGQAYLGSLTVTTDSAGNASFSVTFPIETTENEWITATATDPDGNTSEFSQAVQANTIIPSQLVVTTEPPSPVPEYTPITFVVVAEDDLGEVATNWTGQVTVALSTNPTGATLGGTLMVNAAAGVATFSDLTVSTPGTDYVLDASAPGLQGGVSGFFTVSRATPIVSVDPVNITYGTALANAQLSGTATLIENGTLVNVPGSFT